MSGEGSLFDVPPAAIGRFRVLHQIGAGTSGPVFRAAHPEGDAPLAIKLVTLPILPERAAAVVAACEALVGTMPGADAICQLVDAGSHGGAPYLVTSFAPGDSLDVALKQFGPAAIADLMPRLRALADALDAAADAGVLHGALHPRDVLVSDTSTVLTGLGMWAILARAGERVPVRRPYRAPELSDAAMTAAGDRFSLAALAYEWMTGRRAPSTFVAGDMAPIAGADRAALGRIFARALHADPAERYDSAAAFISDLAEVEVDEAPLTGAEKTRGDGRSRKRPARGAALPVGLPLEAKPDVEQDPAGRIEPDSLALAAFETEHLEAPPELPVDRGDDAEATTAAPAAAVVLRPPTPVESPSSSLLRDSPPLPSPSQSGGLRFAAGLLLGAAIGIGVGYGAWGRGGVAPAAVDDTAASEEVAAPDTGSGAAERSGSAPPPSPVPSTTPDASPGDAPARATPSEPAAAPATPAAAAPATAGNLLVRSTPAGAAVFVDDERRGVTPLALQNVPLGTRRVRIQRDGFTSEDRQVNLTRARPSRSVDVRLTRLAPSTRPASPAAPARTAAARTGSLLIESRPTGASIVLNGRPIGTTPMTIDDLSPGTYTVQLQLPTYRPTTTTVRVVAGERARAAASLVSAQEPQ